MGGGNPDFAADDIEYGGRSGSANTDVAGGVEEETGVPGDGGTGDIGSTNTKREAVGKILNFGSSVIIFKISSIGVVDVESNGTRISEIGGRMGRIALSEI
ncbi:MAG: hypothetical protein UT14_C0033G0022 [Candidatus Shapirobacteria bacterium GW2011_GWE1_38_92]|uniref:Uncharacterized protein n=1 Tax=Candidatus Shapirobacteria bacterium GW2011_GWE1_38_92 TaxID=1618489 RepID=A0A0G0LHX3_9BACT|nr:MAG: hypothetical protein UT14_C0033G0022 [Candidatus Shapirobacteria bacterium GW2011_GWE1_38_92]